MSLSVSMQRVNILDAEGRFFEPKEARGVSNNFHDLFNKTLKFSKKFLSHMLKLILFKCFGKEPMKYCTVGFQVHIFLFFKNDFNVLKKCCAS